MKLRILSDLHLEFAPFEPDPLEVDVVVLAGDIGSGTQGLQWAASAFPDTPIVYVAGNHEFYRHELSELRRSLRATARKLGVHLLDDTAVEIGGVRFLGATLWTDFLAFGPGDEWAAKHTASRAMNDCHLIRDGKERLLPARMVSLHEASRVWLERELRSPFAGPTVVVTHHLPTMRSVAPRFLRNLLTPAFASRRDELVAMADLWVHGHTHDAFDYELGGCRVVCNPRGYPGERPGGFDAHKVVVLPSAQREVLRAAAA